jgi:hypothetical protein
MVEREVNSGRHSSQASESTPQSNDGSKKADESPDPEQQIKPTEIKTSIVVRETGKPRSGSPEREEFDDEESIDDFIRKHLNDTKGGEGSAEKLASLQSDKANKQQLSDGKHSPAFNKQDSSNYDSLSDSDSDQSLGSDRESLTPRQSLLTALLRLSEAEEDGKSNHYSTLNERELFIFDLESILKVLTFKEVCLLVFPCLEIFAVEQEYLKIELFRQLPHVFRKVMKTTAKVNGTTLTEDQLLDILTVNLFPLIS